MTARVMVTGAGGKLARALISTGERAGIAMPRALLDITDADAVERTLDAHRPDLVLNGAAYNLVDKAEEDPAPAFAINATGPANLARACARRGIRLVHFSTDFVFDGETSAPYSEADAPRPLNRYGESKLAGEEHVLAASGNHLVIRVCRLFGPDQAGRPVGNFPALMLKLARERGRVRVVDDQVGSPTYVPDLARGVWELVDRGECGLFHLSNAGEVSFADYARSVFALSGVTCEVEAVSSAVYGAPARRPAYSTLSNAKAHSRGVRPLRPWRDALAEFLAELRSGDANAAAADVDR